MRWDRYIPNPPAFRLLGSNANSWRRPELSLGRWVKVSVDYLQTCSHVVITVRAAENTEDSLFKASARSGFESRYLSRTSFLDMTTYLYHFSPSWIHALGQFFIVGVSRLCF